MVAVVDHSDLSFHYAVAMSLRTMAYQNAKDDDKDLVPPGPPGTATLMRQWSESTIRQLEFSLQNSEMLKQLQDEADEARPLPQHLGRDISALRHMDQFADCTVAGHAAHRLILW